MKLSDLLRVRIDRTGADIGAVVHLETGICLELAGSGSAAEGGFDRPRAALIARDAAQTARIVRTVGLTTGEDIASSGVPVDEVIVTGKSTRYELSQTVSAIQTDSAESEDRDRITLLVYLRFDTNAVSLALARHRVTQLATDVELESADYLRICRITENARQAIGAERPNTLPPTEAPIQTPGTAPLTTPQPSVSEPQPAPPIAGVPPTVLAPVGSASTRPVEPAPARPAQPITGSGREIEQDEYRNLSDEAVRWLKNFKRLTEWTRGRSAPGDSGKGSR